MCQSYSQEAILYLESREAEVINLQMTPAFPKPLSSLPFHSYNLEFVKSQNQSHLYCQFNVEHIEHFLYVQHWRKETNMSLFVRHKENNSNTK